MDDEVKDWLGLRRNLAQDESGTEPGCPARRIRDVDNSKEDDDRRTWQSNVHTALHLTQGIRTARCSTEAEPLPCYTLQQTHSTSFFEYEPHK